MSLPRKPLAELFAAPPEGLEALLIDEHRIPAHVAVIMDGNGRWAQAQGKKRALGHKAGIAGVRELIRAASDVGVDYLTIYSFSTENWARPKTEVRGLMELFANTMAAELAGMHEEGVRIQVIGDMSPLPKRTRETFERAICRTQSNTGMTLIVAINYGSRAEIVRAAQALATRAASKPAHAPSVPAQALEPNPEGLAAFTRLFEAELNTAGIPDPDLLIRTSGEYRLSNFLLYQLAYSELYVTEVLWPDFDRFELARAILEFQGRRRRFGGLA